MSNQRPAGGCANCGGPVRTRKGGAWVCATCYRAERRIAVPIGPNPEIRCCGAIVDDTGPAWTLCHRPFDHTGPHSDEWPRR